MQTVIGKKCKPFDFLPNLLICLLVYICFGLLKLDFMPHNSSSSVEGIEVAFPCYCISQSLCAMCGSRILNEVPPVEVVNVPRRLPDKWFMLLFNN